MTKVVVKAEVEDIDQWKTGFVTHAELFKRQGVTVAYYGVSENNTIATCFETNDLGLLWKY